MSLETILAYLHPRVFKSLVDMIKSGEFKNSDDLILRLIPLVVASGCSYTSLYCGSIADRLYEYVDREGQRNPESSDGEVCFPTLSTMVVVYYYARIHRQDD